MNSKVVGEVMNNKLNNMVNDFLTNTDTYKNL